MSCKLEHVPDRLHRNDQPPNDKFKIGEEIYRRCTKDELENPFKKISIVDISVNRQGGYGSIEKSKPEDVLINFLEERKHDYYDKEVCVMKIKDLNSLSRYDKSFSQEKNDCKRHARMWLVHDPEDCMFHHCEFRVTVDGERVTFDNYKSTIKKLKRIRTSLKQELASMIVQKVISQNS